ncbi:translation initiation factor IF-3 [Limisphaera sp. VF-2]|uniref:translation initiation factor IF-3 n=1 Tax=Limisphaera sp. VF-2 TaxID=3400418 RepID=UPI00256BBE30|nr:translation initiation factor IF-3 [Limisphaera sp.]
MSRPFSSSSNSGHGNFVRVNGKIRAREVRVIGMDGKQIGILPLGEALTLARQHGVDLVEVAPNANPPVCRLIDYGKFRYEQAKKEKEARKHQHANKVKEVQLSPKIDPHDLGVKAQHAIDFLCDEMKVKVALRFRGREMAHTELGFQVVQKFLEKIAPWGHPDFEPKLNGRNIVVMVSPLPRHKRAKHPREAQAPPPPPASAKPSPAPAAASAGPGNGSKPEAASSSPQGSSGTTTSTGASAEGTNPAGGFANNPFSDLDLSRA